MFYHDPALSKTLYAKLLFSVYEAGRYAAMTHRKRESPYSKSHETEAPQLERFWLEGYDVEKHVQRQNELIRKFLEVK